MRADASVMGKRMPTFETLTLDITDRIARITLNRPDAANAMNPALATDLARAALICDSDKTVKAVLVTGNGRMFSAGGDLKSFATFGGETRFKIKQVADELHKAVSTFARMTPVVIIAVNGTAAGAGFSLAMIGDIVIAAETAKFTMAYTAGGLSPDGSSTYYMPRLIGMRRTQELDCFVATAPRNDSVADYSSWSWLFKCRLSLREKCGDAFFGVAGRRGVGDLAALKLHLLFEAVAERAQQQLLDHAIGMQRTVGKFLRQR